ncbi:MAG: o-succinylbenzoate synthase [Chloroflexi bacterium]|nr:o-succinylbenzoate synthase [Chloroflexota bacterium]
MSCSLTLFRYVIPLRRPLQTGAGALTAREGIVVRLTADGLEGWGDCAPLLQFGGNLTRAGSALARLGSRVERDAIPATIERLAADPATASAAAALDAALLDLDAQCVGLPVAALLRPTHRAGVAVNALVGGDDDETIARAIGEAVAGGFSAVKLKVGGRPPAHDIARVARARACAGELKLRIDANGTWSRSEAAEVITGVAHLDLQYVEQPLPRDDLEGTRALTALGVPIALDESVASSCDFERVLNASPVPYVVVKPAVIGGPRRARLAIGRMESAGITPVITSALESGIGICAALHCAVGTERADIAHGLATASLLATDLTGGEPAVRRGVMAIAAAPGLGLLPDFGDRALVVAEPSA